MELRDTLYSVNPWETNDRIITSGNWDEKIVGEGEESSLLREYVWIWRIKPSVPTTFLKPVVSSSAAVSWWYDTDLHKPKIQLWRVEFMLFSWILTTDLSTRVKASNLNSFGMYHLLSGLPYHPKSREAPSIRVSEILQDQESFLFDICF